MTRLAIAAPQRPAAEAGVAAFAAGGNAIDAALAAAASLTVCYPDNCAPGGDLIALSRRADGASVVVNASGPAAAATDADALRATSARMPQYGAAPVTVPGLLAGLYELWQFGAARDWSSAFDAAIAQARNGVEVVPTLAASTEDKAERLAADPGMRALFFDGERPLAAGETLRQPALAASLQAIADAGPDAFYRGEIGASIVALLRSHGSALTSEDLAGFAPELTEPLRATISSGELMTAPPNSQGFLLPLILRATELIDDALDPLGPHAGELAAIIRRALEERDRFLCDPAYEPVPVAELLEPERLRDLADTGTTDDPVGGGDTVAVVTADDAGNTVSLIQSLFHGFGAGILDPATGIICHNRGAGFSLDPRSPNVIAGGKRPAHTLMPCTVLEHGGRVVVAGTMGASRQPQALSQVLLHLRRGAGAEEAVSAPRWVVGGLHPGDPYAELAIESRVPDAAQQSLASTGLPCRRLGPYDAGVGHAQLIVVEAGGGLSAGSDPRSEGAALVVAAADAGR